MAQNRRAATSKSRQPKTHTKILAHKHTGRLRPHAHTSYAGLMVVLVLASCASFVAIHTAAADDSGTYQTTAVVPAPVYKNAPTITNLQPGQVFRTADPVSVTGNCPGVSQVEIFKDDVLAGEALCHGGQYQVAITLFGGTNSLVARAYNVNDIPSPDSSPISIRLASVSSVLAATTDPFYVSVQQAYQAAKTGAPLSWQLTLGGGKAPYAMSVNWGDGKTELFSQATAGTYTISHTYSYAAAAGNYTVVVRAVDQANVASYLQLVGIVRGPIASVAVAQSTGGAGGLNVTLIARVSTVAFSAVGLAVGGFWFGEHRHLLSAHRLPRRA